MLLGHDFYHAPRKPREAKPACFAWPLGQASLTFLAGFLVDLLEGILPLESTTKDRVAFFLPWPLGGFGLNCWCGNELLHTRISVIQMYDSGIHGSTRRNYVYAAVHLSILLCK